MNAESEQDKPTLLKAIELVLAEPIKIKQETTNLIEKIKIAHTKKNDKERQRIAADKIISNYSYYAAFSGGATALTGVIPGLGTAVAIFGGATADAALSMKYQIEMTMALATVYGHDILIEEEKRICYIIAGLGAMSEATKEAGKSAGSKAFINLVKTHLKGSTLTVIKEIFKKLGLTFSRKALEKAIPFGIGVVIGFSANKGLTWYIGSKARDFFAIEE